MDYLKGLKGLALASRMKRMVENLNSDMRNIYIDRQVNFEPLLMPIMKLLESRGALSINEITEFLGISQPAVTQFCNILKSKQYIVIKTDSQDKRKKVIGLSGKGNNALHELTPIWDAVESAVNEMIGSTEHNLLGALEEFEGTYRTKSLKDRVFEKLNGRSFSFEIVDYNRRYQNAFKKLNYEWIEKDFTVEKTDKYVLSNPNKAILEKGGFIFFALANKEAVGTFALIKNDPESYEIAKMAVTEKCQKLGIGQQLLDHAFQKAKELKLKKLILYSNTLLAPAINLYFKNGFRVIPKNDLHNNRANIKMEKIL